MTLIALCAAIVLPRMPPEPAAKKGIKLPVPHRLEVWGFVMGFSGDGVFLLTLAFLMKDLDHFRGAGDGDGACCWPCAGWSRSRPDRSAAGSATASGHGASPSRTPPCWVSGFVLIAADHELLGALMIVTTRGMFNTLIPVLVIERGHGTVLSSQASYSTWRDFGAAVGPLTAPWLFLAVPQTPLYAALALALGLSGYFCLVRR